MQGAGCRVQGAGCGVADHIEAIEDSRVQRPRPPRTLLRDWYFYRHILFGYYSTVADSEFVLDNLLVRIH